MEPGAETGRAAEPDLARQHAVIEEQARLIAELEGERDELRRLLVEAEQRLAELPEFRRRSEELEMISSSLGWRLAVALRVPRERAGAMWLPGVRRRAKHLLAVLMRYVRPGR
jgi:hypothetical protein